MTKPGFGERKTIACGLLDMKVLARPIVVLVGDVPIYWRSEGDIALGPSRSTAGRALRKEKGGSLTSLLDEWSMNASGCVLEDGNIVSQLQRYVENNPPQNISHLDRGQFSTSLGRIMMNLDIQKRH